MQRLDAPYNAYVKQLELPLWNKSCLFEAGVGKNINGNMFALIRGICQDEHYKDYQLALAIVPEMLKTAQTRMSFYGLERVQLVILESAEYNELLARAKYLFNDNTFPAYFTKRSDQVYLNTWHGTPLKRLGLSDIANSLRSFANVQKNLLTANYVLFPNEHTRTTFVDDYDLAPFYSGAYLMHDYPRNDVLTDVLTYTQVRDEQGVPVDTELIAYMPTWRGVGRTADSEGQIRKISSYLTELDACLNDKQILYVNLHFTVQGALDFTNYQHIRPFPSCYETYDFLAACDKLITDYSSVMFDFAATRRPIYLFAYDEDEYMAGKGSYLEYHSLPFPIVRTVQALLKLVNAPYAANGYSEFIEKFCPYHTGSATRELVEFILGDKKQQLQLLAQKTDPIENAYYVFHLGKKSLDHQIVQTILSKTHESSVLITTGTYNQRAIEIFEQLRGKVPILIIVRRHVQSRREQLLLELASKHSFLAQLLEKSLYTYFMREAHQLLSGIVPKRFIALAPDNSYLMWMIKGLSCQRYIATPLKKKMLPKRVQICLGDSFEEEPHTDLM